MSFIACVFVLVGLMHFSVCVILCTSPLCGAPDTSQFSTQGSRFFLPSFLNPNFIPTLQPSSMLSPSPLTVVSSHLSPLQQSSESQLSFSFVLFSTVSFCHFCAKSGKCPTQAVFSKVHSHSEGAARWKCTSIHPVMMMPFFSLLSLSCTAVAAGPFLHCSGCCCELSRSISLFWNCISSLQGEILGACVLRVTNTWKLSCKTI